VSTSSSASTTPSVSASPSSSPQPFYQMFFGTADGGCTSINCTNVSPDDPDTVRVMMFPQRSIAAVNEPNCETGDGGTLSTVSSVLQCVTNLDVNILTDYAVSDIGLYNPRTIPVENRVTWKTSFSPAITAGNTYPNVLYTFRTYAGVANCSQSYSSTFRLGWKLGATNNGPCLIDALYGGFRCIAQGTSVGVTYVDENGTTISAGTRWKSVLCPDAPSRR